MTTSLKQWEKIFQFNLSVGVLVGRVSDEGGFWASMAVRPRAARQPMRAKTDRIRGCEQWLKQRHNHCETRLIGDQHLSPGGDRVGDRLRRRIFVEKGSHLLQKTPPSRTSFGFVGRVQISESRFSEEMKGFFEGNG